MNKQLTFLLMLHFIFLCSIDAFSKEFHAGDICGGNCMVVPQFDKFEEENPDINSGSKTPKKDWKEYWNNGRLKTEIHFKNGKPGGLGSEWYESGKKKSEGHFKNGKLQGLVTQ